MSDGPNLIAQWREARRAYRRAKLPSAVAETLRRLRELEARMTTKQLAQVREYTTEGAS